MMSTLMDLGFNRISVGVQDLNPRVQEAVNRILPESMIQSVLDASRAMAFRSVHMDLIYGLPFQTTNSFMETINRVIDMVPTGYRCLIMRTCHTDLSHSVESTNGTCRHRK